MKARGSIPALGLLCTLGTAAMAQHMHPSEAEAPPAPSSTAAPAMPMDDMPGMDMEPPQKTPAAKPHAAPRATKPAARAGHDAMAMPGMAHGGQAAGMPDMPHDRHAMDRQDMPHGGGEAMPGTAAGDGGTSMDGRPPNDHVPPAPPSGGPTPVPAARMADAMQMHGDAPRAMLRLDRLEYRRATRGDDGMAWEGEAWWGGDLDRLWLKSEGERGDGGLREARIELLWSHAAAAFWDWQLGVRHDAGGGPSRQWAAFGVQGLAPYWFELSATAYAGSGGRTAARLEASYELRFTQRLLLQPRLELDVYGRDDPARGVRAGLSEAEAGLRLRYEISRRFAPYLGIGWTRRFGRFDPPRRPEPARETAWVAGVRFWF
ncbi:copper resistance protein B [Fulvimonas soli]|jgi:copper resistance protein B|uniref:Copper resistance protein B n=1 Tax=Fulvimonas soli TaxID=155197 RepID=A0A316IGQ0_9GAMM|nr:copper resistance protein B [Fulvimonas soli]PWK91970.1 copper resistance protein B [Fulvimonas soli]TNY27416.1 hypothetical protein BV497_03750 [Fulvimonas soli]